MRFSSGGVTADYAGENAAHIFCGEVFQNASTTQQNKCSSVRVISIGKNRGKNILNSLRCEPGDLRLLCQIAGNFFLELKNSACNFSLSLLHGT
jgi:hypothetical protein